MKSENISRIRICPLCGRTYGEPPAISRVDNETRICSQCGSRQALQALGISREEQEKIISIIYDRR